MNKIVINRDVVDEKISFFYDDGKSMDSTKQCMGNCFSFKNKLWC